MRDLPLFVKANLSQAKTLIKQGAVKDPAFSRGTYQFEVQEKGQKKAFPFLQVKDAGEVGDAFCSCEGSDGDKGCAHLAASYLQVFNETDEPLHVRFKKSLWNRLFQMASKRIGYETECLAKKGERYVCLSKTNKRLFWIEAKGARAEKKLEAIVAKRVVETEETSIKFSNLSAEEISQYKAGQASHSLRYELSFWSDLAKWVMLLAEKGAKYTLSFEGSPLPSEVTLDFPELKVWFYIPEVSWPWIIPALHTAQGPLQVFGEEEEALEAIEYDEEKKTLFLRRKEKQGGEERGEISGIEVGDWIYVKGKGFYRKKEHPLFEQERIGPEEIGTLLTQSHPLLHRYLKIHSEPIKPHYRLFFDEGANLHIQIYLFQEEDLQNPRSACFLPWVYLPEKGFFLVEEWLFGESEHVVAKKEVAEFINHHRIWLHQFPAFQTHLRSLESHLIYTLNEEGLRFDAELSFPEGDILNFDEWVYVKGQGFYMKKQNQGRLPLHPGLKVPPQEISSFISTHKEELEQVQRFFNPEFPVEKVGLSLLLNEEGAIALCPKMIYLPEIAPSEVQTFGDFLYIEGRGFSEISPGMRIPERYREPLVIGASQEVAFFSYELEPIRPLLLEIDPRLEKPQTLKLKIRKIVRERKKGKEWWVDLVYESDKGVIDIFSIWDAFLERRRYLFSKAGLLSLKEPRFNWIRQLNKRRLDRKRGMIKLNTLEWIRLNVFEAIQEPKGNSAEAVETRKLLEELNRFETHRLLDITRLKATLRPYQEQGLHWLWFLYCHGLSGLLCDDMGLGKTHQTMALLAGVINEDPDRTNKYLVVCPTSVIYHWQELLKRFLPDLRVCTYYGLDRSLEHFETDYDLLLTSFGILRTGRDNLRLFRFEVAIFDEIQVAKNYASQTHQALRSIQATMRLGLTGTPIENRIRELKSLFDIVLPAYMPPDPIFREIFIQPIEKENDEEKKRLLGKLVKPFILRRKKSEVLRDLPEKIEEISYCDLSEEQKTLYREIALQMKETVYQELKDETKPIAYLHVFSALSTMKRICDHPALYYNTPKQYAAHTSGKWELFTELLAEARNSGQKVVIFSQYLEMIAIIEAYLKKKGIGFAGIKGSTRDRSEQLKKFREDPSCEVFVASLLAAGVGIDLTIASIVIHYDRWWNPAKENQATDRVHRIGQNRGVQVFKLVTKNTVEEHIHEMIERKKGLLEDIIGVEDQINYLSREELLQIFDKMFTEINP